MPQVTIIARDRITRRPREGEQMDQVSVMYSTPGTPPRTVYLAANLYEPATPAEGQSGSSSRWRPRDDATKEAERAAIAADLGELGKERPETFELD